MIRRAIYILLTDDHGNVIGLKRLFCLADKPGNPYRDFPDPYPKNRPR